jgi:type I restriction enzyme S subunit
VTGRTGTLGQVFYLNEPYWPLNTALYVRDFKGNDPHFVAALLKTVMSGQGSTTAAVPGVNRNHLHPLRVMRPNLATQQVIGRILGHLDQMIENNRRRVELLEEMAQVIYHEWFVRFRYPGQHDVPLVASPLGDIPADWEIRTVGDLAVIDKGLSYKGAHLADSGVPMANLKCLRPGGGFRRDGTKPYNGPFKPQHRVSAGDLVMANTDLTQSGAVIGSPAFVPRAGFENGGIATHHLFIVRPVDSAAKHWLYESFRDPRFRGYARGVASGTTVLGFRPVDLAAYQLPVPPPELARSFDEYAADLADLREDLANLVEVLARQRDLLLPKLVTGQIDVSRLHVDAMTAARIA